MSKVKKGSIKDTDSVLVGSAALGSDVSGVLLAANGGTGFGAFTVGDMLYADSVSTLAKVAGG